MAAVEQLRKLEESEESNNDKEGKKKEDNSIKLIGKRRRDSQGDSDVESNNTQKQNKRQKVTNDENPILITYKTTTGAIDVTKEDLHRLNPKGVMNDVIMDVEMSRINSKYGSPSQISTFLIPQLLKKGGLDSSKMAFLRNNVKVESFGTDSSRSISLANYAGNLV